MERPGHNTIKHFNLWVDVENDEDDSYISYKFLIEEYIIHFNALPQIGITLHDEFNGDRKIKNIEFGDKSIYVYMGSREDTIPLSKRLVDVTSTRLYNFIRMSFLIERTDNKIPSPDIRISEIKWAKVHLSELLSKRGAGPNTIKELREFESRNNIKIIIDD